MSTTLDSDSLPAYTFPSASLHTPSYTSQPRLHETRLAEGYPLSPFSFTSSIITPTAPPRPPAEFVKDSRRGGLRLRLSRQADNTTVPVLGIRGPVEGAVELLKPDGLAFVAVRVDGLLKVKEVAGGGTTTTTLCNATLVLWCKDEDRRPCPSSLPFRIALPTMFSDERGTWPLPPTYEAHLSGMPGFTANVDYTVTAIASKNKNTKRGIGVTTVSTPFIYHPRSRPSRPIPPRLEPIASSPGLRMSYEWRVHESLIAVRMQGSSSKNIVCKFYTPASHVLCMRTAISYHITFTGPPMALAALLTYMPSRAGAAPVRACSRIQVLRQTSVDAKNGYAPVVGASSEMWRMKSIGEGSLCRTGDGPGWLSFSGEMNVDSEVKIGGFRAAGLWVKDCIVFTITPPYTLKGPLGDMRCVIPIRLVTDPAWSPDTMHHDMYIPQASPTPSEVNTVVGTMEMSSDATSVNRRDSSYYDYHRASNMATESTE
ncbi:hypothetical protein BC827DRAFT_1134211 [Russula dissimulans]|nr:hypothetical protein BC827DRAFT_1134211 [Russula dissimulans]